MRPDPTASVRVARYGTWFVVEYHGSSYNGFTGTYQPEVQVYLTTRDEHEAMDLRDTLLRVPTGEIKREICTDLPLSEE